MRRWLLLQALGLSFAALAIWLLARSGLDLQLSALAYSPVEGAFPLRDAWLTEAMGHKGLKHLSLALWLGVLGIATASRAWRRELLHAVLGVALAASAVSALRGWSAHSCPWDLAQFGGSAEWFPVFGEVPANPGPGRCLPSGHASTGFGLFALYFALRDAHPRHALAALVLACTLGLLATAVQVARGAHFLSHGLWTAWVCWAVCLALSAAWDWRKILRGG